MFLFLGVVAVFWGVFFGLGLVGCFSLCLCCFLWGFFFCGMFSLFLIILHESPSSQQTFSSKRWQPSFSCPVLVLRCLVFCRYFVTISETLRSCTFLWECRCSDNFPLSIHVVISPPVEPCFLAVTLPPRPCFGSNFRLLSPRGTFLLC